MELTLKEKANMDKAREARAWIKGGSAPFYAAQHCGFANVGLMRIAIARLEAYEEAQNNPVQEAPAPVQEAPAPVQEAFGRREYHVPHPAKSPVQTFNDVPPISLIRSGAFGVEYYDKPFPDGEQVVIRLKTPRPGFIKIKRDELLRLSNLLETMNDLIDDEEAGI